jgi:hypothetical protein
VEKSVHEFVSNRCLLFSFSFSRAEAEERKKAKSQARNKRGSEKTPSYAVSVIIQQIV